MVVWQTERAMMGVPQRTRGVDSARRALQILLQFSENRPEITIEELARQHDISVPSAYRYISLLREMYLIEERGRGVYQLSPQMLKLARAAEAALDIHGQAQPILDRLTAETGETALLLRTIRDAAICIAISAADQMVSISFTPGQVMPLHRGAAAKILLSAFSPTKRDAYLESLRPPLKKAQRTAIIKELVAIASDGFAESAGEVDEGVWAYAAPVIVEGNMVAALTVVAPAFRADAQLRVLIGTQVRAAALELASALLKGGTDGRLIYRQG